MTTTVELILVVVVTSAATATVIFFVQDLMRPDPTKPDMTMVKEFIAQNVPGRHHMKVDQDQDRLEALNLDRDTRCRQLPDSLSAIRKLNLVVSVISGTRTVKDVSIQHNVAPSLVARWVAQAEDAMVRVFLED